MTGSRPSRRRFLRMAGAGLAAAAGAPVLGGCARLLEWSAGNETGETLSMRDVSTGGTDTAGRGGTPASPGATAPSGDAPSSSTTTGSTDVVGPPDLAVSRGDDPEVLVRRAVEALGGMGRFVRPGARVVVKPNVLTGRAPEYAATTNPEVVAATVALCLEAGAAEVTVLDRPTSAARTAFEVSGIGPAAERAGARVKYLTDRNYEKVAIPQGRVLRAWPLVTDIFEADAFISLPIAKTHGMARLTMAMKNLMGVMGGGRGAIHLDFDQKIVDLCTLVKPHLVVLDAYRMLLRNGPTGGSLEDVRLAKTVVAGVDQVTVDAYGTTLFGMKPEDLGYLAKAREQGLGETDLARVRVVETA